ncbi:hypothetical protein [uncultured Phocaeicola sp.]|uniref:hypothetical protein n=1 Tax=uncultured Phocaeicola sp. TaxID=990718 RepID=UPI0025E0178F|nr:hypothetical protein [uncultured Phocaeicola sp.]
MKKILHTIYTCLLWMGFIGFALSGCKDDDLAKNNGDVVEGVPITVTFNLGGKPADDVTVETRASGSDLSDISELVIFIFHKDGSLEDVVTNYDGITTLKVNSNKVDENNNHLYNVTFNTTSGEKKLLAVANVAEGGFWEKVIDVLTVAYQKKYSFDTVKNEIVSLREDLADGTQPFHITASSQMFISGWNEGVVFGTGNTVTEYGKYGDESNQVVVKMNRAMANITFNIKANPPGAQDIFTPTSYRVYNIPTKSYLINDKQGVTAYSLTTGVNGVKYINTAPENIGTEQGGTYTFDFYMPENIQESGKNKSNSNYAERDKWTVVEEGTSVSGALPEDKTWTNAPQNSTFVVISGTYEGNATVDGNNQSVTANVEYTIHLGDFSDTGSMNNYSVERNVSYTYNIKVLGVNNIIVEAKRDVEEQSGAEGSVYDNAHTVYSYNLDAHYEQVYLEYNLSEIANSLGQGLTGQDLDDAIANQLILIIQSEAMDYTHEETEKEPYTTRNKRGTLSPYKIYADAVRNGSESDAADAKAAVLNGAGTGVKPTKGFDYKWIEFLPQEGIGISKYPGISSWAMEDLSGMENGNFYAGATGTNSMLDVYDMIVEMGKAIKQIYGRETPSSSSIRITPNGNDYVARFTAFVNENYYLRHPLTGAEVDTWSVMTNKIPREMIIAMSTQTSTDGNSSYSKIHSYISQLAMQTFYNDRVSSLNAFGIETYNETPLLFTFGSPKSTDDLTDNDGRENQKTLIGYSQYRITSWESYIRPSYNGWTASVGTNRSSHKLDAYAYVNAAYSACMSRNRDLNGNRQIDEDEIRWFLPSLNEYIRMGIGANGISSAAQLYMGDKTLMKKGASDTDPNGYPSAYIEDGSLYYTSSADSRRVYWAVEKGSYGAIDSYYDKGTPLPIRCIRNLPANGTGTDVSKIDGVTSDATYKYYENNSPKLLVFKDRLIPSLYRQRVSGSLNVHNEDDDANSFYDGIFVASDFLYTYNWGRVYTTYTLGSIIGYNGYTWDNPCSEYSESGYTNWRVPNLVELSAMNAAGLLSHSGSDVACCTQFSNLSVRYGFAFSSLIYCPGAKDYQIGDKFMIRCVRDVPPGYTFPTN